MSNATTLVDLQQRRLATFGQIQLSDIQHMDRKALLAMRAGFGLGTQWDSIEIPTAWLPLGRAQQFTTLRIGKRLSNHAQSPADLECALRLANQQLLLCFLSPSSSARGRRLLSITSMAHAVMRLLPALELAFAKPASPSNSTELLGRLTVVDVTAALKADELTEMNRLKRFVAQGLWSDFPVRETSNGAERSRRMPTKTEPAQPEPAPYQPFPDPFVAEGGWRMSWITKSLGPPLIDCARALADAFRSTKGRKATRLRDEIIESFVWRDGSGDEIVELPFEVKGIGLGAGSTMAWPPKTWPEIKELFKILQSAHLFIYFLSTGGRISEALSLEAGAVVENSDGVHTVNGKTYKLELDPRGKARDWPLPDLGALAIRQQEALAKLLDGIGNWESSGKSSEAASSLGIWRRPSTLSVALDTGYNYALRRTMTVLGLDQWLDKDGVSAHRFRKTIARLIALAVVGAPKILMDLFGHKSISMTLRYILTDPGIRSEMMEVAKAQTLMLAESAIDDAAALGGPAGSALRNAVQAQRMRLGRDFGANDVRALAETMTFNGKAWQLVRPGVVCVKGPQQPGPCTRHVGHPEPSRCRSSCSHRLEQSFLRNDVDGAIAQAVELLAAAQEEDDEIGAEMWRGQILTHLPRFPDLEAKWINHPIVRGARSLA